ncbi:ubiquinone biosynthesis methyltransferase UbiE, partial [Rhizobium phaseoli]
LRGEIESRAPERMSEIVDEVAEQVASRYGGNPNGGMSAFIVASRVP